MGYLTAFGGEIDSTVYVSRATWMQEHGLLVLPPRTTTDYVNVAAFDNIYAGLRQGDQYALAFASSLTGLRPHRLFSIWMSVFYGLMPLGAYVFARFGCRLRRRACILTALLVAVQPLLNYVVMNSFFSQASSLGFFCATACVLTRAFRARGRADDAARGGAARVPVDALQRLRGAGAARRRDRRRACASSARGAPAVARRSRSSGGRRCSRRRPSPSARRAGG